MTNFKVGDRVKFTDEFGNTLTGRVTRIIPPGEHSPTELSISIKADAPPDTGWYVRTMINVSAAQTIEGASPKTDPLF